MADEKIKQLRLANITIDAGVQPRVDGLNDGHVKDILEAIERGEELPPLVVYQSESNTLWLSEGFHRAEAYRRKGVKQVACVVRKGDRKDALANACGSNRGHGLKRTNADKRRAVGLLIEAFSDWSNPRIAEAAAVSVEFVRKIRPAEAGETREGADGKKQPAAKSAQVATVATCSAEIPSENTVPPPEPGVIPLPSLPPMTQAEEAEVVQEFVRAASEKVEHAEDAEGQSDGPPPDRGAEFVAAVETLCRDMDQIAGRMKALKESPYAHSIHIDSAVSQVEAARKTLWQGRPAHACPYCAGEDKDCKACKGTGRVKKTVFDSGAAAKGEAA